MTGQQQYCTFFLGDLYLGVEVRKVQEVLRYRDMTRVPLTCPVIRGLINLRGQIVPALDLRVRLDMPPRPIARQPMNVVVATHDGIMSLLVDEIGDVLQLGDETFERTPETVRGSVRALMHGVFKLKDRLLLLLDLEKTVNLLPSPSLEEKAKAGFEVSGEW
jgi:purine-binding chemotaxis protein CheW